MLQTNVKRRNWIFVYDIAEGHPSGDPERQDGMVTETGETEEAEETAAE